MGRDQDFEPWLRIFCPVAAKSSRCFFHPNRGIQRSMMFSLKNLIKRSARSVQQPLTLTELLVRMVQLLTLLCVRSAAEIFHLRVNKCSQLFSGYSVQAPKLDVNQNQAALPPSSSLTVSIGRSGLFLLIHAKKHEIRVAMKTLLCGRNSVTIAASFGCLKATGSGKRLSHA